MKYTSKLLQPLYSQGHNPRNKSNQQFPRRSNFQQTSPRPDIVQTHLKNQWSTVSSVNVCAGHLMHTDTHKLRVHPSQTPTTIPLSLPLPSRQPSHFHFIRNFYFPHYWPRPILGGHIFILFQIFYFPHYWPRPILGGHIFILFQIFYFPCLLYRSPSPRDRG